MRVVSIFIVSFSVISSVILPTSLGRMRSGLPRIDRFKTLVGWLVDWLIDRGDYTTQLYGDYNKPI